MEPFSLALLAALAGGGSVLAADRLLRSPPRAPASAPRGTAMTLAEAMLAVADGTEPVRMEPGPPGAASRTASAFNAMARAIEERERSLHDIARCDTETGLLTRRALELALDQARQPDRRPLFVAAVQVDRFSTLRQNIGYALAASVIRELGERAGRCIPGSSVGRLGTATLGIGFAAADTIEATAWLTTLRTSLERQLDLGGHVLDVTVTIGYAGADGADGATVACAALIERAELAADQAKSVRSKLTMFSIDEFGDPSERLALMRDLRGALANGDIFLCYQPKFRSRTNEIDAIEALIRWRHPERGMIAPEQFIALAEETGEIRAVTEWVLKQAMRDQAQLAADGFPLTVYVNISGRLLGDRQFADSALRLARDCACPLGFEITETAVIFDPDGALRDLAAFAAAGIRIAIDDYGSGWSSLAYLKKLPAHELKIDRMFISDLTGSHRDPLLVRSTIDLAHALEMEVTAEGVDTPAALALLRVMGCDLIQGFLIAPPMTVDELVSFLGQRQYLVNIDVAMPTLTRAGSSW